MKFKYEGEPIYDVGLLLEKRSGADIDINNIVKNGDIITTTDERCIRILETNPHYEKIYEKEKVKVDKKKSKKQKE